MKKLLLCTVVFSLLLNGCTTNQSLDNHVKITNKLQKNIVCIVGYNYPDLSFKFTSKQAVMASGDKFEIAAGQEKVIDTLGLCNKETWDKYIKKSMLMVFVFDKDKLATSDKLEDALLERYYFSYVQLTKINGIITVE